jgi:hypothetical protein
MALIVELIGQGPGLVAKFPVPQNFHCESKEGDQRPGYARFTTWNEATTFVPLESPTDNASLEMEETLKEKWRKSCVDAKPTTSNENNDDLTHTTASLSLEEASTDSDSEDDTISHGSEDSTDDEWEKQSEDREGDDGVYHAMILLGTHVVDQETFWVLQNSWPSMPIIEMSTQYLAQSGAALIFYSRQVRSPRSLANHPVQFCASPIAKSNQLERMDCE